MKNRNRKSHLALGAAVVGLFAGATVLQSCGGAPAGSSQAERHGCNGPNGCGGQDQKAEANGCSGPNGCDGHGTKGKDMKDMKEANGCSGPNGCNGHGTKK
jgi:hypothetical protein